MRPRKRDARRALLIGAGVYLTLHAGLSLALATELSWLRSPDYAHKRAALAARLKSKDSRPLNVVMFGSSRVLQGLRGDYAEESLRTAFRRPVVVYNFGVVGAGPFRQMLYLRRLLADGIRPDLVLLEVLPPLLGDRAAPRDLSENQLPIESLRFDELPLVRRYALDSRPIRDADWWLAWLYPAHAHRFAFVSHSTPILLSFSQRLNTSSDAGQTGWLPPDMTLFTPERLPLARELSRKEYAEDLARFKPGTMPLIALSESLDMCREAGIHAALVLMPEGPAFRSWYSPSTRAQIAAVLDELRRTHDVPVIDASAWFDTEDGFVDSHHMTPDGAVRFSRLLAERTLIPLLSR